MDTRDLRDEESLEALLAHAPVQALPRRLRRQMEAAFAQPFDDVLVHHTPLAHALNEALGSQALTIGRHLLFRHGAYAPDTAPGRHLLAHELAHVVQKRLGRRSRSAMAGAAALEREADRAAHAVSLGLPFECRLADHALRPAPWGCAGHFYAVYLAYLNAQASDKDAFKTALYCWLPDQVEELDAKHLFLNHVALSTSLYAGTAGFPGSTGLPYGTVRQIDSDRDYYQLIHRGIHCLNGGDSAKETEARTRVLQDSGLSFLLRGVAHHPFGDSFAHRNFSNPKVMYDVGIGHGTDLGHPDEPWSPDRGPIFLDYVGALQDVATAWTRKPPLVPIAALKLALDPVLHMSCRTPAHTKAALKATYLAPLSVIGEPTGREARAAGAPALILPDNDRHFVKALELSDCAAVGDETACCDHIKRVAADLVGRPMRQPWYDPVREPRPWIDYYREHKPLVDANVVPAGTQEETAQQVLTSIRAAAKTWVLMPR